MDTKTTTYLKGLAENTPSDWLNLTTHRLDVFNEGAAKTAFVKAFESLVDSNNSCESDLSQLPTAFDYIRLGHPLSCVLEWTIAKLHSMDYHSVISFSSQTAPILAILRKNQFAKKNTQILYSGDMPIACFDADILRSIYKYKFDLKEVASMDSVEARGGDDNTTAIFISSNRNEKFDFDFSLSPNIDFFINVHATLGSVVLVNGKENAAEYVSEIQHVRRRETIAMTPANSLATLKILIEEGDGSSMKAVEIERAKLTRHKTAVLDSIKEITGTRAEPLVSSSGLSMQYAILMGLIHHAAENNAGKAIRIVVPPNCYGGTNDQARRVAACLVNVEVVDLLVDAGNDMVTSVDRILEEVALEDAVAYIVAEIPTNPRVEVPDLTKLKDALAKVRTTSSGATAVDSVFILDQTFCPNINFLGEGHILSGIRALSYASGSKFPSGGKCTAGYCVANDKAASLMEFIKRHLVLCDNEATTSQYEVLAQQLPSMKQRIQDAYLNTREFVNFIQATVPAAKINFVSEALAADGFTPSVFSLDLPTKGSTDEDREAYKRAMNLKLINAMIQTIPDESKHCVSYGQLKGVYWTVPATSTQGTTKEGDKDYITRVSLSPNMDMARHKQVFSEFAKEM